MTRGDGQRSAAAKLEPVIKPAGDLVADGSAKAPDSPASTMTVQPIDKQPDSPKAGEPQVDPKVDPKADQTPEIEMTPDPARVPTKPHHGQVTVRHDPPKDHPKADPVTGLTRDAVAAKFTATTREYGAYKAKFGMRLDQAWGDLTTFIQFQLRADNLDEATRRIEAFRARMRE